MICFAKPLLTEDLYTGKDVSMEAQDTVKIHHQATTVADTADWKDLVCAIVHCKVYKSVRLFELLVVMSCKS
jgi:hypothetical protein